MAVWALSELAYLGYSFSSEPCTAPSPAVLCPPSRIAPDQMDTIEKPWVSCKPPVSMQKTECSPGGKMEKSLWNCLTHSASGSLQIPKFPALCFFWGGYGGRALPHFPSSGGWSFVVFAVFLASKVNSGCHGNSSRGREGEGLTGLN